MSKEHVIRISVFANRNPSLSKEQFHAHWIDKHGPLVSSWLQKHGFVQYTQFHTPASDRDPMTQGFEMPTLSYDGVADFYVKSLEEFKKAYDDSYYKDVVKRDEEYLFDVKNMRIMVGTETHVIEEGKIVQSRSQTK